MATQPVELDFYREMRSRCEAGNGVFWTPDGELAVFEPEAAQKINALNFADLTLPDKLADLLRGKTGDPVSWKLVRAGWISQLRRLSEGERLGDLAARMDALLAARLDRPLDLAWAAQQVITQALVPAVVAGLSPADTARVLRDQHYKLARLMRTSAEPSSFWKTTRSIYVQVSAGSVMRRELRGRARGKRPRQVDLTDPIVDLLPALGLDRAVDAITAMLTAIAGPPGAAAGAVVYELTLRPDWAAKVEAELAPISPAEMCARPAHCFPVTHRFVKEVLRMWSPPIFMTRQVRTDIRLDELSLDEGQRYLLSTYLIHHDPRHWEDPDTFDPDRWLPNAPHGPANGATYVPFGWSPKACVGAGYGTTQLMLLCHLLATRYRIELEDPDAVRMVLAAVPLPVGFTGTIRRR